MCYKNLIITNEYTLAKTKSIKSELYKLKMKSPAFPSHFMKSLSNSIVNNLIYLYTSHLNLFLNLSKTSKRKIWKLYFILHITSIKEFSTLCLVLKYKEESIAKHKFDDLWKV